MYLGGNLDIGNSTLTLNGQLDCRAFVLSGSGGTFTFSANGIFDDRKC